MPRGVQPPNPRQPPSSPALVPHFCQTLGPEPSAVSSPHPHGRSAVSPEGRCQGLSIRRVQHGPARAPGRGRPAREPENQLSLNEITAAWPAVSARQHRAASNRRFRRSTLENRGFLQALGVHGVRPQPREFLVGAVFMPCRLALGCGVLGCQVLI